MRKILKRIWNVPSDTIEIPVSSSVGNCGEIAKYAKPVRIVLGVAIVSLCASAIGTVSIDLRTWQRLREAGEAKISVRMQAVARGNAAWLNVQEADRCEANGICNSRIRTVGLVYREFSRHVAIVGKLISAAGARLRRIVDDKNQGDIK